MKHIITLLFFGLILFSANAQIKKYYPDGSLQETGFYNDKGQKTGKWLFYRDAERLHQEDNYLDGKAHGEFKSFFENGNLIYERFYQNGTPIGVHKEYYKSGILKIATTFEDGKKSLKINYYESSKISNTRTFGADKSLAKSFYENGTLGAIGHNNFIEGGQQIGKWKFYHENGKLHYKGRYEEGKRVGKWKGWHANGKRKFKGNYVDGEEVGLWKYYDESGKLKNKDE